MDDRTAVVALIVWLAVMAVVLGIIGFGVSLWCGVAIVAVFGGAATVIIMLYRSFS